MTTQVVFRIDKDLKGRAMKKARLEGIALTSILMLATKAYVVGDLEIKLKAREELKTQAKRRLEKSLHDIQEKKNLSAAYDSAQEAIRHLRLL